MPKIDVAKISPPKINLTVLAKRELALMLENDVTLEGKVLRVQISGKGCDGFTYSCGFTLPDEDDFIISCQLSSKTVVQLALAPFTAFYLQRGEVDFVMGAEEGFTITNFDQSSFRGKFWRDDPRKVPPLKKDGEEERCIS